MKKISTVAAKASKKISQPKLTVGLDLGDRNSWYCVLDESGQIQREQRVRTNATALREVFGEMPRCRIALEIGTHSPWISRLLRELGHEVIVANARKVRLIGESRKKDDRLDAQTLARLARIDPQLLYPVKHRSAQAQADLLMIRARAGLVRTRTALVNTARGLAKSYGERLRGCCSRAAARHSSWPVRGPCSPARSGCAPIQLVPESSGRSACACALRCFTGYSNCGSILANRASVCASSRSSFLAALPDQSHLARIRHDHFMPQLAEQATDPGRMRPDLQRDPAARHLPARLRATLSHSCGRAAPVVSGRIRPARSTSCCDLPDPIERLTSAANIFLLAFAATVLIFFIAGLLFICALSTSITWERTSIPSETGLLIPSVCSN